jgi:hypothetical protein
MPAMYQPIHSTSEHNLHFYEDWIPLHHMNVAYCSEKLFFLDGHVMRGKTGQS